MLGALLLLAMLAGDHAAVIARYLSLVNPLDKAGAYAIQEGTDLIIAGWRGSYTNIVGLPVEETKQILTRCGLC